MTIRDKSGKDGTFLTRVKRSVSLLKPSPTVDYPQEGEKIFPGHYAVRISAPGPGMVELSVDSGEWQACRPDVGYFWFDWWPTEPGRHRLAVRFHAEDGSPQKSKVRACTVVGPSSS